MVYVGSSWVELDYWTSPSYGSYDARLRVLAYSTQDIVNNTSRIYFKLQKRVTGGSAYQYDPLDFKITGYGAKGDGHSATQTWNFGSVSDTSWTDVGGDTSDMYWSNVKHNDNGSLTITANASGDRILGGTFDNSITIELPTIARASKPTATPNPLTIGSSGVTLTINTNRKSSSFMHTVKIQCGSWSWTSTARSVGTSVNVTVPYSVIAQFSAMSKTATATITCTTFSGSTQIGSAQTATVTFQVNSSVDHANIGTITIQDTNARTSAVTQDDSIYIANISTLQATIPLTVSGDYTELAQAVVTCGNKSQTYTLSGTSASLTFEFDKVNASSLTVTVKDKRGNSVTGTKSWTLIAYQPVTAVATVGRPSATGSVGVGQLTGMAYGGNFGATQNSLNITIDFKKHDDLDYDQQGTETATLALGQSGYNSYTDAFTFAYTLDYQYQYDIKFTVSDLFSTATYVAQLMQGLPIISWDETEVDVFGDLHIHDRDNPTQWQDVMDGFDAVFAHNGQKNFYVPFNTITVSGITFTLNADDSYKVVGTASANAWGGYANTTLPKGEYIMSGGTDNVTVMLRDSSGNYIGESLNGQEFRFTVTDTAIYRCYLAVANGNTVNTTIYPMIRDARIASDEFMPYAPLTEWNYKTFSNSSAGVTSGSVRWIVIGRVCFANFYDVVLTNTSHATNAVLCSGLPPARTAMLFLISAFGTGYSAMRMRIDTDGNVYFHYAGTSLATQHYGQVFYIVK